MKSLLAWFSVLLTQNLLTEGLNMQIITSWKPRQEYTLGHRSDKVIQVINLWTEWAKIEIAAHTGGDTKLPKSKR